MNDPRSHSKYRRLRKQLLGRPGSKPCVYCGAPATEADHVVAVARGGDAKSAANLVPACRSCNRSKGKGAAPRQRVARSVFSTQRNHTPAFGRVSLPVGRYATIRGDFTRREAE